MGVVTDLTVAGRMAARGLKNRLRGELEPAPDLDAFEAAFDAAIASLPDGIVRTHRWLRLPATTPPWYDTGVDVGSAGDVTTFAHGRVYASAALDIWVAPHNQIWTRVGEAGPIQSSSRDTHTLRADATGRLHLGNYFPNDWKDSQGARVNDDRVYQTVQGETSIAIVEWEGDARVGLEALVAAGDPYALASGELERLSGAGRAPEGWHYLWNVGEAEIFQAEVEGNEAGILCRVEGDVGILQKPVDVPLAEDTALLWDWRVDAIPGLMREDSVPSHDYLSIAVEFDNGWDLTYYWSRCLAPETGYICPLPNWKHREYHVAIRSGEEGLGVPHSERRWVLRDYQAHMAGLGETPTRIVAVWLIANSVFARQLGSCRFANIRLSRGGDEMVVL